MSKISFILPAYNEEENVPRIYEAIDREVRESKYDYEFIYVDDGSKDRTLERIRELQQKDNHVNYVSFSRNFGKEAAIYAGLQHATGDAVILMDSDLQHPPSLIMDMMKGFEEGYHQVIACRDRRGESMVYRGITNTFYRMMNKLSTVELQNGAGDFRLLSRQAVDALLSLSENNRFSKGLFEWIGLSKKNIYYENVERQFGETKWSVSMLFSYAVDGILSFNTKPLRICLYLGLLTMLSGIAYIAIMLGGIFFKGIDVPGYFTTISAILVLGGLQLMSLGVIGEYIGRIYCEVKRRPHYIVGETNVNRALRVVSMEKSKVNSK
ncbi:MAG: glycosyltransferase family 2 protein [Kurthia gibsonii]|uniref:Glycosyltransferase family 2 protein n=1 Tax=Kurthia gibsonii TaxID=33946 RepID=A0ABU9LQ93_9BACL|nr:MULTISPECIES: glycosyltransferase family 2 protein [Kurthia]MCA9724847.1 glycosyltransferase family 2 protein [Kurthia sp.]AMA64140.1 glycosyltransferase like 2 family protein [Kurthia sp. 11kri321]MEB6111445.1 glycosyltransferase family 2 protein [Kurthia gibsonii]MEB7773479.1 glycosyltransferase family 2 protein [Kurthia gibsonii]RXH52398.1 glycosyltransferase [Kurthia gibsonii]